MSETKCFLFLEPTCLSFLQHFLIILFITLACICSIHIHKQALTVNIDLLPFLSNHSVHKSAGYGFICFIQAIIGGLMFSSRHLPGGTGPKFRGVHHIEPSRKRLRRQTEASRQPEAAVQARGYEQARQ